MNSYMVDGSPDLTAQILKDRLGPLAEAVFQVTEIEYLPIAPPAGLPALEVGDEGIDTSHNQPPINFAEVATHAGKKFTINKATEGWGYQDPQFAGSHQASHGLLRRGAYHFFRPDLRRPKDQAQNFLNAIRSAGPSCDLMPYTANYWIDLEDPLDGNGKVISLAPFRSSILPDLKVLVDTLVGQGIPSGEIGFYTRRSWFNFNIPQGSNADWIAEHDLWAAGYPYQYPNTTYRVGIAWPWAKTNKPVRIWQYGGGTQAWETLVPGLSGPVDRDIIVSVKPT